MAAAGDLHLLESPNQIVGAGKDGSGPATGSSFELAAVFCATLNEHFDCLANHLLHLFLHDSLVEVHEPMEALVFYLFRDIVFPTVGGGSFPGAVREEEGC